MNKRKSLIYGIVVYVLTCALVLVSAIVCSDNDQSLKPMIVFLYFLSGAVVFGFLNTVIHEFGHIITGKKNNFEILSFTFWFFNWTKINKKFHFSFTMIGDEAGYTESVPKSLDNLEKRVRKMSLAGPIYSLISFILSLFPYIWVICGMTMPAVVFCLLAMWLPISFYYFAWNICPIISEGVMNDGAVAYSIQKDTPTSKVMISLLKINSELYNGKTPSEIDKSFYFDVPQLAEDDLFFALILNARYNYYLDSGDNENAIKTMDRLFEISDYFSKAYQTAIKADYLYTHCVLKIDEEKADEMMYEVEKYLNNINTATNIRIKLAYLQLIKAGKEQIELFYKKGIKEAKNCQLKGLCRFETKLLEKLNNDNE